MIKISKSILLLALYYLLMYLIVFYTFVLRAALELGRIPSYNKPDPQELGFSTHFWLVFWGAEPIPYCLLAIVIYGIICWVKKKNILKINKFHFIVFGLSVLLSVFTLLSPLFEWFID